MKDRKITDLISIIRESHPKIKLVYLFGQQVTGKTGAMSDYDFAFHIDEKDIKIA